MPTEHLYLFFFYHIHSHWTRPILQLLPTKRNLNKRCCNFYNYYRNSFSWICPPLRTNILLGGNSYYKPPFSCSLFRTISCNLSMRWILSQHSNPYTILLTSLPPPIYYYSAGYSSLIISPRT